MRKTILLFATLLMLGAGCSERVPPPPPDETPNSNQENCEISGGKLVVQPPDFSELEPDEHVGLEAICACPEGYAPDPADFCLDAQGRPGGEMAPK